MQDFDIDTLRHLDLSRRPIDDLSPVERAELLRRYSAFVDHFGAAPIPTAIPAPEPKRIRKWVPGMTKADATE